MFPPVVTLDLNRHHSYCTSKENSFELKELSSIYFDIVCLTLRTIYNNICKQLCRVAKLGQ